jgi:heme oxygenase (biliverdin-IX-beta and delta-forming)
MIRGAEARRFLRARRHGVLATISRRVDGYPFGSVVPYLLDHAARPVIFISRLAEHTANLEADPRLSLLVSDGREDVQAGARLTLLGDAVRGAGDRTLTRYLSYFPDAEHLVALGDFAFYCIEPRQLRFIRGFGEMNWISAESYAPPANALATQEDAIVMHMNAEHARSLRDYCRFYHRQDVELAVMAGIDCDGFDVRGDGALMRIDFDRPVADAREAREALVAMAQKARAA